MLPKGRLVERAQVPCGLQVTAGSCYWRFGTSWYGSVFHNLPVQESPTQCLPQFWFLGPTLQPPESESSGTRPGQVDSFIRPDTHAPVHFCRILPQASTVLQGFLSDLWGSRGTVKLSDPRSGPQLMTEESREAVPWPPDPAHAETDPCPARCPRIP